jgi:hypothetical protein
LLRIATSIAQDMGGVQPAGGRGRRRASASDSSSPYPRSVGVSAVSVATPGVSRSVMPPALPSRRRRRRCLDYLTPIARPHDRPALPAHEQPSPPRQTVARPTVETIRVMRRILYWTLRESVPRPTRGEGEGRWLDGARRSPVCCSRDSSPAAARPPRWSASPSPGRPPPPGRRAPPSPRPRSPPRPRPGRSRQRCRG